MGIPPTKPGTGVNKTQDVTESKTTKTARQESRERGDSSRAGHGVEADRRADGAAMKARVQTAVDLRKGYEALEKSHTVTDAVLQKGREVFESKATKALSELQDTQNALVDIDRRMKKVGAAMAKVDSPSEFGQFNKLSKDMGELAEARKAVVAKLDKAESALVGLRKELKAGDKMASSSSKISEGLE
jgi:hypothetical protein